MTLSHEAVLADLRARLEKAEAENAVRTGEWCRGNREAGRGPCGACPWCCADANERARRATEQLQSLIQCLNPSVGEMWRTGNLTLMDVGTLILDGWGARFDALRSAVVVLLEKMGPFQKPDEITIHDFDSYGDFHRAQFELELVAKVQALLKDEP